MAFRFGIVWNPCHSKEILLLNQEILSILSNNDVRQGPKTARQFIAADKGIMWKRICSEKEYHVMTEDIDFNDAVVEEFIQNLQLMYREVKSWLTGFVCKENLIEIYEEYALPYKAPELYIYRNDGFLCKIKPVGAHIIAADGRADLIGKRDKLSIALLKESRAVKANSDTKSEQTDNEDLRKDLYLGYEGAGWYVCWGKRRITKISSESFSEAMESVSGYKNF